MSRRGRSPIRNPERGIMESQCGGCGRISDHTDDWRDCPSCGRFLCLGCFAKGAKACDDCTCIVGDCDEDWNEDEGEGEEQEVDSEKFFREEEDQ